MIIVNHFGLKNPAISFYLAYCGILVYAIRENARQVCYTMGLKMRYLNLKQQIREVRMLAIRGIAEAGSGHPGASFSAAEIMGGLYFRYVCFDLLMPVFYVIEFFVNFISHSALVILSTLAVDGYFPIS